jgi:hypothetical protein
MAAKASDFLAMSRAELRRAFAQGHAVEPEALADSEYKGVSLGMPAFVERLTWKKFKKVFCRDDEPGVIRGWNVRLEQNELDAPCIPKRKNGKAVTFGHFVIADARGRRMAVPGEPSILLDYSRGENAWFDFMRFLRDPLVALNPGDMQLLLGAMYIELGSLRLPTPSFFTLEYDVPIGDRVTPPGRRSADSAER